MSTISEFEKAAATLPADEQAALLRHLSLDDGSTCCSGIPLASVPPPAVPKEELQRIHALIEAEFSRVSAHDW